MSLLIFIKANNIYRVKKKSLNFTERLLIIIQNFNK